MAFDFGSKGLGITNPFKQEGAIRSIAGVLISLLGFYSLFQVTKFTDIDLVNAWIYALVGFILLVSGLRTLGSGLFQLFKFFVGRSVPTSLAANLTKSEVENAQLEQQADLLTYSRQQLESMLMGRKNSTFKEPKGWTERFIYTLLPKLIFVPYPIRNVTQEVIQVILVTVIACTAFILTYFVSATGLAGKAGHVIIPIFSFLLLVYLTASWSSTKKYTSITDVKKMRDTMGSYRLAKILAFSILGPAAIGWIYHTLAQKYPSGFAQWEALSSQVTLFSAWPILITLLVLGALCSVALLFLLKIRTDNLDLSTEVSEYRDNLQETVHPNEIFINIENIVLANRRYNEMPNRTYINFEPTLNEQSQGKGDFGGELLIETQPEYTPKDYGSGFKMVRLLSTLTGQFFLVLAAYLLYSLVPEINALYGFFSDTSSQVSQYMSLAGRGRPLELQGWLAQLSTLLSPCLNILFLYVILISIGRIFANYSHLFWAELQFNSLLMYMKTEGTFSESKISTGMSIHDSTRSENVIVKSSITPWIITSRVSTSTFASSGTYNVEMPRFVMTLNKNDAELKTIVDEVKQFLKQRQNIAGLSNTADLQHAENIYKVNQASRVEQPVASIPQQEAAGFINQEANSHTDNNN